MRCLAFHHLGDAEHAQAEFAISLRVEPRLLVDDCAFVLDTYLDLPVEVRVALRRELLAFRSA